MEQKPSLGRVVLVKTAEQINGQNEHAAIITQVWSDTCINVMVLPGFGAPFAKTSVTPEQPGQTLGVSWRWPPRV